VPFSCIVDLLVSHLSNIPTNSNIHSCVELHKMAFSDIAYLLIAEFKPQMQLFDITNLGKNIHLVLRNLIFFLDDYLKYLEPLLRLYP